MEKFRDYLRNIKGTAALEFAFIFPVFLLFVFGSIELGYLFWADSSLKYGATYGARYAFVHPTASTATIQNFALSVVDVPGSVISYTVTNGGLFVDIDGSLTYNFLVVPLNPITINVHARQVLPLP
ncbi:MAG: pilus assembly protein [Alphaproteobacteria bacterium]|nr:pilus assembly protein [Alphaproteobacteria bacterium]